MGAVNKILKRLLAGLLVLIFLATLVFLFYKSRNKPAEYESEQPVIMDIVKKTVTTGSIIPKKEIEVKSRISGIIKEIYVEPGDAVEAGALLASIKIMPDNLNLNRAERDLNKAQIVFENTRRELARQKELYDRGFISEAEYNKYLMEYQLAKEDYESAENNLLLIREGASRSGQVSNLIHAPAGGMILEVPVKTGSSVIESNSFNEGTNIAVIADMNELIFEGYLDESEIGKIGLGMDLDIQIAAIEGERFHARLDYIAPKGEMNQGAIQFRIRATIHPPQNHFLRAGYSANADIVLARAEQVLAVSERNILFQEDKSFVEVQTGSNRFQRREVELGLSDGIMVEIKSGLSREEAIKIQPASTMESSA